MGQARGFRKKSQHRPSIFLRLVAWFCALAFLGAAGFVLWLWSYAVTPIPMREGGNPQILIPPKTSLAGIEKILAENGVIPSRMGMGVTA